ncbi:hypothetical protein O203_17745 [Ectopseudomonas chengduensis]|nr:hypothetical protein O203_17745 [Pseudomonas chengduensis]
MSLKLILSLCLLRRYLGNGRHFQFLDRIMIHRTAPVFAIMLMWKTLLVRILMF